MEIKLKPGRRSGTAVMPSSKSEAHRRLICAALSGGENRITVNGISNDVRATVDCLAALGFAIRTSGDTVTAGEFTAKSGECVLPCGESGATLRFLLPLAGALGARAVFDMKGRLPRRPTEPLKTLLESRGMRIEKKENKLYCRGRLIPGEYEIAGDISSQFISGLLFALPLLDGDSTLRVTGRVESAGYIALTEQALAASGIVFRKSGFFYKIKGGQHYNFPEEYTVPGDWSAAAAFACMGALSNKGVTLKGLDVCSLQPDKKILDVLRGAGAVVIEEDGFITVKRGGLQGFCVNAADTPDLVPALAALASVSDGKSVISGAGRLRFKESDRLAETAKMLSALGAEITETPDGFIINGKPILKGGAYIAHDHRIAMAAAVAACAGENEVTVKNAECADKSYPGFWEDFDRLEVEE